MSNKTKTTPSRSNAFLAYVIPVASICAATLLCITHHVTGAVAFFFLAVLTLPVYSEN